MALMEYDANVAAKQPAIPLGVHPHQRKRVYI